MNTDLIENNLNLVKSRVKKFLYTNKEFDDLYQIGCVGLIKAANKFNNNLGYKFSTYAVTWIDGEIRRHIRDDQRIHITRTMYEGLGRLISTRGRFYNKYNRLPTLNEMIKLLDMTKEEVSYLDEIDRCLNIVNLDSIIHQGDGEPLKLYDAIPHNENYDGILNKIYLEKLINTLTNKEKNVIINRYYKEKSQVAIAKELGVNQVNISRMEKKALNKMKINGGF